MTIQFDAQSVTNLLESAHSKLTIILAKPWHYRRNGRYYLRLRPQRQPSATFTISLRTSNRTTAMEISTNIQRALAYFHLNNPEATWPELKARLLVIAEECLSEAHCEGTIFASSEAYREMYGALKQASTYGSLTLAQHKALTVAQEILSAAHARLEGRAGHLVGIIDKLNDNSIYNSPDRTSLSLSVGAPQEPLSWDELATLYMEEHSINLKESSRKAAETTHTVIGAAFRAIGVTDLRTHTREDITALRTKLLEGRKPSTVNNLLAKLRAVMTWAVRAEKLTKQHTDKIKITKGADSDREAFDRAQVVKLMGHANALPVTSWERWALSLAVITGARVGEISYLTKADIRHVDGLWCIDINEDAEGKSIKNKHSKRLVPLVDGALGFDLSAFREAVELGALPSDNKIKPARASQKLNLLLQEVLGDSKEENQTLHSLRHHLVSSMQAAGVPVAFAQSAVGHSSGTIAYGVYGSGSPVQRVHEAIKQGLVEASE